ncbi:MAG TPA: hypothetical protein VFP72_21250 [Kineosporiaceae bacterium]|nr:hypothetical protein [Kineosporiaceae bacterium]
MAEDRPGQASGTGTASGAAGSVTASGPGRALITVYGIFALAATSRAGVQLATRYHQAPLAYLLSAFSGVVYLVATVALARRGPGWHRVATVACTVELAGVLLVGMLSLVRPGDFAHPTVWSGFGSGYGFVPLVLPVIGLWWLRRTAAAARAEG